VNSISEEVLYYKGYFELREVHHFTSSAQGRYCIANFIDFMSNDHRVQLVSAQSMPELLNYHGQGLAQTGDPGNRILSEAGLTGLADIVGVADSGINDNSCYFFDNSGAYGAGTVTRTALGNFNREPLRRKVIQYVAYGDGYDSIGGHGTHVVGTIVGDALNSDYSASNGVAPGAKVIFLDVEKAGSPYLLIPALDEGLLYQQYKSGARVFSNSWGSYSTGTEFAHHDTPME
jgi:subtilisin family serine protease